jgi:hypothetical protein
MRWSIIRCGLLGLIICVTPQCHEGAAVYSKSCDVLSADDCGGAIDACEEQACLRVDACEARADRCWNEPGADSVTCSTACACCLEWVNCVARGCRVNGGVTQAGINYCHYQWLSCSAGYAPDDTDTGSDLDADVDVDADTDADCDPPTGIGEWGGPCMPEASNCPAGTYCITVEELDESLGYCAPLCCEGDHTYCTDIGSGLEQCLVNNSQTGEWWCVVLCNGDNDCVDGTSCQPVNETTSICYGAELDTDTATGTDTDVCAEDDVAICDAEFGACQLACEADAGPSFEECVADCLLTYCECIVGLGCDPAEYDCE